MCCGSAGVFMLDIFGAMWRESRPASHFYCTKVLIREVTLR
jgi:hypothetical protein